MGRQFFNSKMKLIEQTRYFHMCTGNVPLTMSPIRQQANINSGQDKDTAQTKTYMSVLPSVSFGMQLVYKY